MVDIGNNNVISTLPKDNFQAYDRDFDGDWPQGRFSNGKILLEYIAQDFGLKSPTSLLTWTLTMALRISPPGLLCSIL
ncbi:unnamed protein product [Linum trigynum]|uniref:Uncharacterized protein n=1 Tax=Linum trigynum TaxID=586398 RepID=A0AAV2ETJ7_9ROSI